MRDPFPDPLVVLEDGDAPKLTKSNLMRQLREALGSRSLAHIAFKRIVREYKRMRRAKKGEWVTMDEFYAMTDRIIDSLLRKETVER